MPDLHSDQLGLLLCLSYYHPHVSGLSISAAEIAEEFTRRGHRAMVVCSSRPGLARREAINGVEVTRSHTIGQVGKAPLMPLHGIDIWQAAKHADIVALHLPYPDAAIAAIMAKLRRRKLIISYAASISRADWISRVTRALAGLSHLVAGMLADRIQVVSQEYADNSTFCRLFRQKLCYAPPPTPFPSHEAIGHSRCRPNPHGPLHIGYVGRLARQKSLNLLLEAFKGLPELMQREVVLDLCGPAVDVVGEEDWRQTLEIAENSGGLIRYHGVLPRSELDAFYAKLDLLVLPSTDRQESFGLVQVEAMLQGVPVVASNLPGMREPVRQTGMGLLAKPGDPDDLRNCIAQVLRAGPPALVDPQQLRKLFGPDVSCAPFFELAAHQNIAL